MVGAGGVENGQIEVAQPNPVGQSAPLNTLVEGCRLPVNRNKDDAQGDWTPAEILSIRKNSSGENQYYVHYVDFNKRLDEWVTQHRLDHRLDPFRDYSISLWVPSSAYSALIYDCKNKSLNYYR